MPNRMSTALLIGLAGALSLATATGAMAAKAKKPSNAVLNANAAAAGGTANAGVPVLAHQMGGYRPGLCHVIVDKGRELGYWDTCKPGHTNPGP